MMTSRPLDTTAWTAWWRRTGSNRRPPACKAGALPAELHPQTKDQDKSRGGPGRTRTSDPTLIKRVL